MVSRYASHGIGKKNSSKYREKNRLISFFNVQMERGYFLGRLFSQELGESFALQSGLPDFYNIHSLK